MAVDCSPQALLADASCWLACTSESERDAIRTMLLAQIAGGSTDPQTLLTASRCFLACLPPGALKAIQVYLTCQIVNGTTPPPPDCCENAEGIGSPVGVVTPCGLNQYYHDTEADCYWVSTGLTNADWTSACCNATAASLTFDGDSPTVFATEMDQVSVSGTSAIDVLTLFGVTIINTSFDANGNTFMSEIAIGLVETIGGPDINAFSNPNLTTIDVSSLVPTNGQNIDFSGNALNQATVDLVLARAVANAGYVSGTISLGGGTNSAPSAVLGLVNKGILTGRGVVVTNN